MELRHNDDNTIDLIEGSQVVKSWGGDQPWMARDRAIADIQKMLINAPWGFTSALFEEMGIKTS